MQLATRNMQLATCNSQLADYLDSTFRNASVAKSVDFTNWHTEADLPRKKKIETVGLIDDQAKIWRFDNGPVYKTNLVRTKSLSDHGPDQIWLCKRYLSVPKI